MSQHTNPFKKIRSKHIYESAWVKVEEDDIIKPNGEPGIYGRLLFKNYAIGIIALSEEFDTWLVGQYRYVWDAYSWEIPEGGGAKDIDPLESAKRELREETGLIAARWEPLIKVELSNSITDELGIIYLAQDLEMTEPDFDDTEVIELRRVSIHEAIAMVHRGEIRDSLSVIGLLYMAGRLSGQHPDTGS